MKLIKALIFLVNWVANAVVLFFLMFILFFGFIVALLGFQGIMLFYWLGEHIGILRVGVYNDKHDVMREMLPTFREVVSLSNVVRPPRRKSQ